MKRISVLIIAFSVIFLLASATNADLLAGLVAYYPFNGNADDESGNGNHGTVYGAVLTTDRFGNAESAYNFNGVNNYIQIAFAAALHPSIFSLSAWFNTTDTGRGTIITSDLDSKYCNHGYELGVYNGLGFFLTDPTSNCQDGKVVWSNNPLIINNGAWHHIVAIFDGSQMMLYVDGVLQDQIISTSTYSKPNSYLRIGMTKNSGGYDQRYFDGFIDEVRIYNRALSDTEVQELYNEASNFVYPVLGISQTDPLQNNENPLCDGWKGKGVGELSAKNGHLGQDYYLESGDSAGKPVFAVANGEIVEVLNGPGTYGWCDNRDHGWGPVVVIKHTRSTGFNVPLTAVKDPDNCGTDLNPKVVYSLYGHLSKDSIKTLYVGQIVHMGQQIGTIGSYGVDQVSWKTNHLHFELKDEKGYIEGTWYKSYPKTCPGSINYYCQSREIKGVGTAYSMEPGFAPYHYVPSLFINKNRIK